MSYKLIRYSNDGVRIGTLKAKGTPRFFMINDFGGGGTNVSRFLVYSRLFAAGKSEILLNYYYLNTKFSKTPAFNTDILKGILRFNDIRDFLESARRNLIETKKNCLDKTVYQPMGWSPLVLLDSGSGNIFRDILPNLNEHNFGEISLREIRAYIDFCEQLRFDVAIGLDIAGKYTWKKGEATDEQYHTKLSVFSEPKWNLSVSKTFLQQIPEKPVVAYYAAIHGNAPEDYLGYLNIVLSTENDCGRKYSGFAIGNLGNAQRPNIYRAVKLIRNRLDQEKDCRPIHILGVGSIQNIIPLSLNGADTFDCHSPWRRASEDKLVIPLLNSDFEITARDDSYWSYVPIDNISALECDCEVCSKLSLSELKRLKDGTSEEKYYFRILAYKHNIHQQETLCGLTRSDIDLQDFARNLPDSRYKIEFTDFLSTVSKRTLS